MKKQNDDKWGLTLAIMVWKLIFFLILMMIGYAIATVDYKKELQQCQDQVEQYEQVLSDPHHCISVVIEMLGGKDEITVD